MRRRRTTTTTTKRKRERERGGGARRRKKGNGGGEGEDLDSLYAVPVLAAHAVGSSRPCLCPSLMENSPEDTVVFSLARNFPRRKELELDGVVPRTSLPLRKVFLDS